MRLLVCGDRWWTDAATVHRVLRAVCRVFPVTVVVHGACRGADLLGQAAAKSLGLRAEAHPAFWHLHGRAAGPIRNRQMVESGLALALVFHDDLERSTGTKDMVNRLRAAGVPFLRCSSRRVR